MTERTNPRDLETAFLPAGSALTSRETIQWLDMADFLNNTATSLILGGAPNQLRQELTWNLHSSNGTTSLRTNPLSELGIATPYFNSLKNAGINVEPGQKGVSFFMVIRQPATIDKAAAVENLKTTMAEDTFGLRDNLRKIINETTLKSFNEKIRSLFPDEQDACFFYHPGQGKIDFPHWRLETGDQHLTNDVGGILGNVGIIGNYAFSGNRGRHMIILSDMDVVTLDKIEAMERHTWQLAPTPQAAAPEVMPQQEPEIEGPAEATNKQGLTGIVGGWFRKGLRT